MNSLRLHIPTFVDHDSPVESLSFESTAELLALSSVQRYAGIDGFSHFAISDSLLMAVYDGGSRWFVVGTLADPAAVPLPKWSQGHGTDETGDILRSAQNANTHPKQCDQCGTNPVNHQVSDQYLCCQCYVEAGHPPAVWHPDCCTAFVVREKATGLTDPVQKIWWINMRVYLMKELTRDLSNFQFVNNRYPQADAIDEHERFLHAWWRYREHLPPCNVHVSEDGTVTANMRAIVLDKSL